MRKAWKQTVKATRRYTATLTFTVEIDAVNAAQAMYCLRQMRLIPHGVCGSYMVGEHTYCDYFFRSYRTKPTINIAIPKCEVFYHWGTQ